MKYTIIYLLFLSACGKGITSKDPRTISGINPAIIPYVEKYISQKGSSLYYDIPIQFTKLSEEIVGTCTVWSNGYRQIVISEEFWFDKATTEKERIALLFHELGHCDLNRDHVESRFPNGWPKSLMFPYVINYPDSMEKYYFDELFNPIHIKFVYDLPLFNSDCIQNILVTE